MKKIINSQNAPAPIGPYNQAVFSNGFLFVSGQIPIDPLNNQLITDDIEKETKQVMENLQAILLEAGMTFKNVVKSTIFLSDLNNFVKVNEIYGSYFNEDPPARETVQVAKLPKNAQVEISVIAAE